MGFDGTEFSTHPGCSDPARFVAREWGCAIPRRRHPTEPGWVTRRAQRSSANVLFAHGQARLGQVLGRATRAQVLRHFKTVKGT